MSMSNILKDNVIPDFQINPQWFGVGVLCYVLTTRELVLFLFFKIKKKLEKKILMVNKGQIQD